MIKSLGNGGILAPGGLSPSGPMGFIFSHAIAEEKLIRHACRRRFQPCAADPRHRRGRLLVAFRDPVGLSEMASGLCPSRADARLHQGVTPQVRRYPPRKDRGVRVDLYSKALQYDSPSLRTDLAARFSFRHAAALSLCLGPLRHDGFSPGLLGSPDVQAMAARVRLVADPMMDALYSENRPTRVTLELADGSQAQAEVMAPRAIVPGR
jgi:hypothetical protein